MFKLFILNLYNLILLENHFKINNFHVMAKKIIEIIENISSTSFNFNDIKIIKAVIKDKMVESS